MRLYINKYFEVNLDTSTNTSYYYLGGTLVAMSENATLRYTHQDHLTGTSVVSDSEGALISSIKYTPYGETRSGDVPTDKRFTGQRLDDTGLYYYGARYYDPSIGRFISADTIVPDPANPQSLNRYFYCLNNPLKYTDPSGHIVYNNGVNMNGVNTYNIEEYVFGNYGYDTDILVAYVVFKDIAPDIADQIEESDIITNMFSSKLGSGVFGDTGPMYNKNGNFKNYIEVRFDKSHINLNKEVYLGLVSVLSHESAHALGYIYDSTPRLPTKYEEAVAMRFQYSIDQLTGYVPHQPSWFQFWDRYFFTNMYRCYEKVKKSLGIDLNQNNPQLNDQLNKAFGRHSGLIGYQSNIGWWDLMRKLQTNLLK